MKLPPPPISDRGLSTPILTFAKSSMSIILGGMDRADVRTAVEHGDANEYPNDRNEAGNET